MVDSREIAAKRGPLGDECRVRFGSVSKSVESANRFAFGVSSGANAVTVQGGRFSESELLSARASIGAATVSRKTTSRPQIRRSLVYIYDGSYES
jgi:hypothetical protein